MNKIMNKFIKTSLVMASLMGAITLNAWHCNHCNRDHRGRVCPATGHTQDTQYFGCGDPYGCWRMDVDSDDAAAAIQNMNTTMQVMLQRTQEVMQRQHRQARAQISSRVLQTFQVFDDPGVSPLWVAPTVPLVGHMPKGTPVFGPIQKLYSREGDYIYKAKNGMNVVNIKGLWLYECYMQGSQNFTTMFAGDGGEFYDSNGKPLKQVGTLANGRPVYQGQDFLSPKLQLWALGEYSEGDCMLVTRVEKSFGRFAYTNYNAYCMAYLFDGRVWINKYTGKIYNSVEELP